MKLVTVVYEGGIDESVTALLSRLKLPGWTKLEGATGFGRKGLRLGTAIWPGTNTVLLILLPDDLVPSVLGSLEQLKREYVIPPALTAYVQSVEQAT